MLRSLFLVLSLLVVQLVFAQYYEDKDISVEPRKITKRFETETWKTAFTVPRNRLDVSVFAPVRYGLTSRVELQTYLGLWAYLTPNLYIKKNWYGERSVISSKHGVYYPSVGLERLKNDGENSTLREWSDIPQIVTFQNEIIFSYIINPTCNLEEPYWIATARLGGDFSLVKNRNYSFNRMTFYSLYHRTASFYGDRVFYTGLQLDGGIWTRIYFNIGADVYTVGNKLLTGVEAQGNLVYHYNSQLSFSGGVKYILTNNTLEKESHILPMFDICYRFGADRGWQKGLFGKKR